MKKYTIGLDLGVSSIGWSIINNETAEVEDFGVRKFSQSKTAEDRRVVRGGRRTRKRKLTRAKDISHILQKNNFPSKVTTDENLIKTRVKSLKERIEKQDITNILMYFAKNRGYIPFDDDSNKEKEKMKLIDLSGLFPCEYYLQTENYELNNKYRGTNEVVNLEDNIREIRSMLIKQAEFYKEISAEFIEKIIEILKRKREFWEGPGSINQLTPYGRFKSEDDVKQYILKKKSNPNYEKYLYEELVGRCSVYINEYCVPKINYYAEYFNFLNDFINIRFNSWEEIEDQKKPLYYQEKNKPIKLNKDGLLEIKDYIISNRTTSIPTIIKKVLGTNEDNIDGYRRTEEGKMEFSLFNFYIYIIKQFEKNNLSSQWLNNIDNYNLVIYYLTITPGIIEFKKTIQGVEELKDIFNEEDFNLLAEIKRKKSSEFAYHSFSEKLLTKAIDDMIKHMMNYMSVSTLLKYNEEKENDLKANYLKEYRELPLLTTKYVDDIIASPQIKKTLRQAIRIVNEIIKNKGYNPYCIAIESTKEMNGKDRKNQLLREQENNRKNREKAKEFIASNFGEKNVTNKSIERVMLYNEINGHCPYCEIPININDLIYGVVPVEHILPISASADNSYDNKTISCKNCNDLKKNRTPYQFLNRSYFEKFEKDIWSLKTISEAKKINFTSKTDVEKYGRKFINRNLRDTAYATKEMVRQIDYFNIFLDQKSNKILTLSTPGQLTAKIRESIDLEKSREVGDAHHAVDASIVGAISTTEIGETIIKMQNDSSFWLNNNTINIEHIKNISLNPDTIQKIKTISEENTKISVQTQKNPQAKLSNANLIKIIIKDGQEYQIQQIDNIYEMTNKGEEKENLIKLFDETDKTSTPLCFDNDKKLYNHIKEILTKYIELEGNPFINYAVDKYGIKYEDFDYRYHGIKTPAASENAPVVKKIRYYKKINDPYYLTIKNTKMKDNTKVAIDSLNQYCIKIYKDIDAGKFIFLPIYSVSVNLKTREINEEDYLYIKNYNLYIGDKNVEYLCSLHKGELVEVIKKNGEKYIGYVSSFDKTNNLVELSTSDKKGFKLAKGDKELTVIHKDILGNVKKRLTKSVY